MLTLLLFLRVVVFLSLNIGIHTITAIKVNALHEIVAVPDFNSFAYAKRVICFSRGGRYKINFSVFAIDYNKSVISAFSHSATQPFLPLDFPTAE